MEIDIHLMSNLKAKRNILSLIVDISCVQRGNSRCLGAHWLILNSFQDCETCLSFHPLHTRVYILVLCICTRIHSLYKIIKLTGLSSMNRKIYIKKG